MKKEITMKRIEIFGYKWDVDFVAPENQNLRGNDGCCLFNKRLILIRNDVGKSATECILRHELTHAMLCVQGRHYQRKFDVEEVCELVAFLTPAINSIVKEVKRNERKPIQKAQ